MLIIAYLGTCCNGCRASDLPLLNLSAWIKILTLGKAANYEEEAVHGSADHWNSAGARGGCEVRGPG